MSWFYDTFLPSLLERAGTNKGMWLSRKQTAICIEKMEQHTTMVPQLQGDYCRHNYYTLEWNGRHVFLNYSKLNGCGQITFGFDAAEAEEASRRRAEEERREAEERMERKRKWTAWARENAPEKLAQRIARHQSKVDDLKEAIEDILEDLREEEAAGDTKYIEIDRAALERAKNELAEAEAIWKIPGIFYAFWFAKCGIIL